MWIQSQWTLSWGGVSLLAATDMTDGELKLPAGSGHYQDVAPARSAYALRIGRGNIVQRMSFRRLVQCVNATQARIFALNHLAQLTAAAAVLGNAPDALLSPITGGQWLLGNCKVTWTIEILAYLFVVEYQIECGAVTQIVVPPDPNPPPAEIDVTTVDGTPVTTVGGIPVTTSS